MATLASVPREPGSTEVQRSVFFSEEGLCGVSRVVSVLCHGAEQAAVPPTRATTLKRMAKTQRILGLLGVPHCPGSPKMGRLQA